MLIFSLFPFSVPMDVDQSILSGGGDTEDLYFIAEQIKGGGGYV
jgi:hypothetical protein